MAISAGIGWAQELKVLGMNATSEIMPASAQRKDLNGNICALIKVQLPVQGAGFEGSIVGDVIFSINEYLVYVAPGTKMIRVKCPGHYSTMVSFPDCGVPAVESKCVYNLRLQTQVTPPAPVQDNTPAPQAPKNEFPGKNYLMFHVSPPNAKLVLDGAYDLNINANGEGMALVSCGTHTYRAEADGYETATGEVAVTEGKTIEKAVILNPQSKPKITKQSEVMRITYKGHTIEMVRVDGGTFQMGSSDNGPVHKVTLTDYYIGQTEVTQSLWEAVMGYNNSGVIKGADMPVTKVTWEECQEFVKRLSAATGRKFALPTEAQWEFAARGGNASNGYKYSGADDADAVGWYKANSRVSMHEVKTKAPNELGIYDMSGNVDEWCYDRYDRYNDGAQTNPTGADIGGYRVVRGGNYLDDKSATVTDRDRNSERARFSYLGFRLAMEP